MEPKSGKAAPKSPNQRKRKEPGSKAAPSTSSATPRDSAPSSAIVIGHNVMIFAAQCIIGIETTKTGKAGLSEQLWEGLETHRTAAYADEVGKQFDEWLASTATDDVRIKCAKWRSGGYLANMLKNCRRIAEYALTDPSVWGCTSFGEAHKRANQKADPDGRQTGNSAPEGLTCAERNFPGQTGARQQDREVQGIPPHFIGVVHGHPGEQPQAGGEATGGGKVEYLPEEYTLQLAIDLDAMTPNVRSQVLTGMRRLMIQWGALDVAPVVDTVAKVA